MINYDVTQWATMFRASQLYLRALRRKKHAFPHPQTNSLDAHKLNYKVVQASRFTPYYHF